MLLSLRIVYVSRGKIPLNFRYKMDIEIDNIGPDLSTLSLSRTREEVAFIDPFRQDSKIMRCLLGFKSGTTRDDPTCDGTIDDAATTCSDEESEVSEGLKLKVLYSIGRNVYV